MGFGHHKQKEALHRLDKRVAKIIQATKDTGTYPQNRLCNFGDHYQINVDKMIHFEYAICAARTSSPLLERKVLIQK